MKSPPDRPAGSKLRPVPDRKEWDFRALPDPKKSKKNGDWTGDIHFDFLEDDDVWWCWNYEFTRQEPEWTNGILTREVNGKPAGTPYRVGNEVAYILEWRAGAAKPNDFDSLLDHYWSTDPNGKVGISLTGGGSTRSGPNGLRSHFSL